MRRVTFTLVAASVVVTAACNSKNGHGDGHASSRGHEVPLYDNLGSHHHEITTMVPLAQRYFDQGLRLLYAFNHAEAAEAFGEAERLDPDCAMCAWGAALAYGPNINAPMEPEAGKAAYAAVRRAMANVSKVSTREQAFVRALAERYTADPAENRAGLDSAYARAMEAVADGYLDDLDAQVLHADAVMNLSPWNHWTAAGKARLGTEQLLSRLEYALDRDWDHPGACHLYIHALEAHEPERAFACAERLPSLMPGAGHVVHMPAHIYVRVGRYADAIETNEHAVHADESYLEGGAP